MRKLDDINLGVLEGLNETRQILAMVCHYLAKHNINVGGITASFLTDTFNRINSGKLTAKEWMQLGSHSDRIIKVAEQVYRSKQDAIL